MTETEQTLMKVVERLLTQGESRPSACPFRVGDTVFIRTVTHHLTGRVCQIAGAFVRLEDAAWIADDGRFMQAIEQGTLHEVEPVTCKVWVNCGSIVDAYEWRHALPRTQQ